MAFGWCFLGGNAEGYEVKRSDPRGLDLIYTMQINGLRYMFSTFLDKSLMLLLK